MNLVVLALRIVLAAVFVVSAVGKVRDREGSRGAVAAFGVPTPLVGLVATALPVVEVVAAVLLFFGGGLLVSGAALILAMLVAFTIAIVTNLLRGRRPQCHCFGAMSSSEGISWRDVARNVVLAVLAAVVLLAPRPQGSVVAELTARGAAVAWTFVGIMALLAVIAVMAWALTNLVRSYGSVLARLETVEKAIGLDSVRMAPSFSLPTLDGETVSLEAELTKDEPILLAFVSPTCSVCAQLLPELARWQHDGSGINVLVVSDGTAAENAAKLAGAGADRLRVLLQPDFDLARDYNVLGTPAALWVTPEGQTAVTPAHGIDEIRALRALMAPEPQDQGGHVHQIGQRPIGPGDEVPDVSLTSPEGVAVPAGQVLDDGVLVFWRTGCSFCAGMLEQMKDLEVTAPLAYVTPSSVAEMRASGLSGPVWADPGGLGDRLGVPGTPSAIRVSGGFVQSEVAVGAAAVIALFDRPALHDGGSPEPRSLP